MSTPFFLSFITYLTVLLIIGIVAHITTKKRIAAKGEGADFMVGARSLNFWITAFSAHASDMSNWLFMGFPAMIYSYGLTEIWAGVGLVFFMYLNWHFIAPKMRQASEEYDCYTLSSYFEKRYDDDYGILRILTGCMLILFFTIYISALLHGIGKLFVTAFATSYLVGVCVGVVAIMLYTVVGGFVAVAWIDSFQAVFLLAMIVLVPSLALCRSGGLAAIMSGVQKHNVSLHLFRDYSFASLSHAIMVMLGWGLGYFGMPHIQSKFMGIERPKDLTKAKWVGTIWQICALGGAVAVGLVSLGFFSQSIFDTELLFIKMVQGLFSPYIGGVVLCAILAATISTIDSMVLVLASVVTDDFYMKMVSHKPLRSEMMSVFRLSIIGFSLIAAAIALGQISSVYSLVWYAWSGLGCSFGPLLITSLYCQWVTRGGAIAGIVTGGLVSALWPYIEAAFSWQEVPAMIPGFFASLIAIAIVSSMGKKKKVPSDTLKTFKH